MIRREHQEGRFELSVGQSTGRSSLVFPQEDVMSFAKLKRGVNTLDCNDCEFGITSQGTHSFRSDALISGVEPTVLVKHASNGDWVR